MDYDQATSHFFTAPMRCLQCSRVLANKAKLIATEMARTGHLEDMDRFMNDVREIIGESPDVWEPRTPVELPHTP